MPDVKPIPDGYSAITPYLISEDAGNLINFLAKAFGSVERVRMPMPGGAIGHAEVVIGGAVVMLSSAMPPDFPATKSAIHLYVEDVDSIYAQAVKAGATSLAEPEDQFYGERMARVADPAGNTWLISTHIEDVSEEEMTRRMESLFQG